MEHLIQPLVIAVIAFVIGILVGRSLGGRSAPTNTPPLMQDSTRLQQELISYRHSVETQLNTSVQLFNQLHANYSALQQQLHQASQELCDDPVKVAGIATPNQPAADSVNAEPETPEFIDPPRDYAPKHKQDEPGTLTEGYGLKQKKKEEEDSSVVTPRAD